MGMGLRIVAPIIILGIGVVLGIFILRDGTLPEINEQNWGPPGSPPAKEDTSIRRFQINISEKVLNDLKTRLSLELATLDERVPDTLEGIGFEYGINKKFVEKVGKYWLNQYDWNKDREKLLNKYPSFKTKISGIDIHFQHVKPTKKGKMTPLLLLHGWPGSFVEFQGMIPSLINPKDESDINFELVIPSLPGFGFSGASMRPGLGPGEMSLIFFKLMQRLGHEKFYVSGNDWGSLISSNMATLYKDNVLGIHMTMCLSSHPRVALKIGLAYALPYFFMEDGEREMKKYSEPIGFFLEAAKELGYFIMQGTKPDTVGVALSHSPIGYASWILEKFSGFTNSSWLDKEDGGILAAFNLDQLLDNVMVHWLGKSATTSARLYRETLSSFLSVQFAIDRVPVETYVSCINFPNEPISFVPRYALIEKYPKLRYTIAKTGGHLSAFEVPEILADDIIKSVKYFESLRSNK